MQGDYKVCACCGKRRHINVFRGEMRFYDKCHPCREKAGELEKHQPTPDWRRSFNAGNACQKCGWITSNVKLCDTCDRTVEKARERRKTLTRRKLKVISGGKA
jgi:hypothetical protein